MLNLCECKRKGKHDSITETRRKEKKKKYQTASEGCKI